MRKESLRGCRARLGHGAGASLAPGLPNPARPRSGTRRATSLLASSRGLPRGARTVQPRSQGEGGTPRSLTLVAVGQEVGAGPEILPVESVYGDVWILSHLPLERTHSAGQQRRIRPQPSPPRKPRIPPPATLPGICCRLTIGQPGSATSNHRSPEAGGAVPRGVSAAGDLRI